MQWIKTERNQLIPPLQMVSGIVERCHTMPILAHVMITKNGSELAFLANDLEVQITVADQRLTIQAGKSRFALQTLDAGDFPTVAQAQTFDLSVQITQKAF